MLIPERDLLGLEPEHCIKRVTVLACFAGPCALPAGALEGKGKARWPAPETGSKAPCLPNTVRNTVRHTVRKADGGQ